MSKGEKLEKINHNPLVGGSNPSGATINFRACCAEINAKPTRRDSGRRAGAPCENTGLGVCTHKHLCGKNLNRSAISKVNQR